MRHQGLKLKQIAAELDGAVQVDVGVLHGIEDAAAGGNVRRHYAVKRLSSGQDRAVVRRRALKSSKGRDSDSDGHKTAQ